MDRGGAELTGEVRYQRQSRWLEFVSRSKRLVCVVRFPVTVAVSFQIPAPTGPIDDPRLPGRTLGPPADDQPHPKHFRHRAPSHPADQRQRQPPSDAGHGLSTPAPSRRQVAKTQRLPSTGQDHRRSDIHRRRRAETTSSIITSMHSLMAALHESSSMTFGHISGARPPAGRPARTQAKRSRRPRPDPVAKAFSITEPSPPTWAS